MKLSTALALVICLLGLGLFLTGLFLLAGLPWVLIVSGIALVAGALFVEVE